MKEFRLERANNIYFIYDDSSSKDLKKYEKVTVLAPFNSDLIAGEWDENKDSLEYLPMNGPITEYKKYSPKNETAFQLFFRPQEQDIWEVLIENKNKKYNKCENPYFPTSSSKKAKTHKIFNSYLSKDQKIIIFSGLLIAAVLLIGITILTSGAAAGVMFPGALGFLNAMSGLTGIASASLATSSGFAGLVSIAVGSILLSILCFTGVKRMGSLGSKENFFPGQKDVEEEHPSETKSTQNPAVAKTKSVDLKEIKASAYERKTIFEDINEGVGRFSYLFQTCISNICCLPLPPALKNENSTKEPVSLNQ